MSNTPRTDEHERKYGRHGNPAIDLARTLEADNATLRELLHDAVHYCSRHGERAPEAWIRAAYPKETDSPARGGGLDDFDLSAAAAGMDRSEPQPLQREGGVSDG